MSLTDRVVRDRRRGDAIHGQGVGRDGVRPGGRPRPEGTRQPTGRTLAATVGRTTEASTRPGGCGVAVTRAPSRADAPWSGCPA